MSNFWKDYYYFNWRDLHDFHEETEIGIEAFQILCSSQEQFISDIHIKFDESVKTDIGLNSMEPEEYGGYYRSVFKREETVLKEIQRQQRYAICISIFSFFEGRLQSICERIESKLNFKLNVHYFEGFWNYLTKVLEIDIHKVEKYYTPIKQHKIVRNIIVHQEGFVKKDQRKEIKVISGLLIKPFEEEYFQRPYDFNPKDRIEIVDSKYIDCLLENIGKFFKELCIAIDIRYQQIKTT